MWEGGKVEQKGSERAKSLALVVILTNVNTICKEEKTIWDFFYFLTQTFHKEYIAGQEMQGLQSGAGETARWCRRSSSGGRRMGGKGAVRRASLLHRRVEIHKYKYANTNTHIQIHKYKRQRLLSVARQSTTCWQRRWWCAVH